MFPSSYHRQIFRSYYQWQKWRPCKRSKVKVTEANTQLNRFRTVTPVWIHIWWWNDAYSLMMLRRGALLFFQGHASNFKVISLENAASNLTQIGSFRTVTPVWSHQWLRNDEHSLKRHRRGALLFLKVIRQISRSHGSIKRRIWPRLGVSGLKLQFEITNGYEMMHKAWSSIEEVPYCFWRSSVKFQGHTAKKSSIETQIRGFRTVTPVRIHQWLWNDAKSLK